ncbi:MAG: radical SAM protein, partial [Myxococcota bacterium]
MEDRRGDACGGGAGPDRWRPSLILTVTRRRAPRAASSPTGADGGPPLSADDARRAIDLFVARTGGGDVKLVGGEPLLRPDVVTAVMRHIADTPHVSLDVSTDGTRLTDDLLTSFAASPRVTLALSLPGEDTSFAHVERWLPRLLALPRFVV